MSRPGINKPGPPAWEASTLEKSHLDSLFAGYSEPLLGLRVAQHPASTGLPQCMCIHGHMDFDWGVGRIALAMPGLLVARAFASLRFFESRRVTTIERLDQGHLYPLGEPRDKHVTGEALTSAPLHRRRTLYLKSYLDSLFADYSEPLLGLRLAAPPVLYKSLFIILYITISRFCPFKKDM
jgi:hypothetical protein